MSDTNDQSSEKYNPFTAYLAAKAKQSRDLEKQMALVSSDDCPNTTRKRKLVNLDLRVRTVAGT